MLKFALIICFVLTYNKPTLAFFLFNHNSSDHNHNDLDDGLSFRGSRSNILPDKSVCGLQNDDDDRVYGGEETTIGEFPWMALLKFEYENGSDAGYQCGGTVINEKHVLTAAHCVRTEKMKLAHVRLGEWDFDSNRDCVTSDYCSDAPVDIKVDGVIVHPYFSRSAATNDIALIRLKKCITFTEFIRPICLPESSTTTTNVVLAGWGITENKTQSSILMKATVSMITRGDCERRMRGTKVKLTDGQVCAGEEGKGECKGDSGGPLMSLRDGRWYQEGIVSIGRGCGAGYPGVYTRVEKFREWILNNLKE